MSIEWPLKRTHWSKFYLRQGGLLSQTPPEPHEQPDSFVNDPWQSPGEKSNCVTFSTPPLAEDLEMTGPSAFYFHAALWLSTEDANWFVNIWDVAPDGSKTLVTKGWLKASHRELDQKNRFRTSPTTST